MKNKRIIFLIIIVVAAFGYLLMIGMQEGSMYYLEVSEYLKKTEELGNRKVRVNGMVVKESLNYDPASLTLIFTLKDTKTDDRLKVLYKGTPPDLLNEEGVTAVAEGHYDGNGHIFEASQILVKCPSKYERKGKQT